MDALKIMTEGMVKEEQPVLNIGDTVRVDVRIKEGSRENQAFEGTIIARGSGVSRPSPFAAFPTASVSKGFPGQLPAT